MEPEPLEPPLESDLDLPEERILAEDDEPIALAGGRDGEFDGAEGEDAVRHRNPEIAKGASHGCHPAKHTDFPRWPLEFEPKRRSEVGGKATDL